MAFVVQALVDTEIPAWKQRGIVRRTSAERKLEWQTRRAAFAQIARNMTEQDVSPRKALAVSVVPAARLAKKSESRTDRKRGALFQKFRTLPAFIAGGFERYRILHAEAAKLFETGDAGVLKKLSMRVREIVRMRAFAERAKAAEARHRRASALPVDTAWRLAPDSFSGFRSSVAAGAARSAVLAWMTPRSGITAVSRAVAHMKCVLDEALRVENQKRKKAGLPEMKRREELFIFGQYGSFWLQFARGVAQDAVLDCEARLDGFHFLGTLTLFRYKKAFGLQVRDNELLGLGPRHFAAAEALLALEGGDNSEKRAA